MEYLWSEVIETCVGLVGKSTPCFFKGLYTLPVLHCSAPGKLTVRY